MTKRSLNEIEEEKKALDATMAEQAKKRSKLDEEARQTVEYKCRQAWVQMGLKQEVADLFELLGRHHHQLDLGQLKRDLLAWRNKAVDDAVAEERRRLGGRPPRTLVRVETTEEPDDTDDYGGHTFKRSIAHYSDGSTEYL
jgi:hypothetical protein